MKNINHSLKCLAALAAGLMLGLMPALATDFHVTTAQDLQNALTLAAANGRKNNSSFVRECFGGYRSI
jgi:hypothetical protein